MKTFNRFLHPICILAVTCLLPAAATADTDYDRLVVFGDSLSDPGNAFALTGEQSVPPYGTLDDFLVPSAPYAKGGHHLSNGATWIEQLGKTLKVNKSVGPAWKVPGVFSNYALDRARARDDGINVNLSDQIAAFVSTGQPVPQDALVVIWIGGNDVRDALGSDDPEAVFLAALTAIGDAISVLYPLGARHFLVGNVPDLGLIPSIQLFAQQFPLPINEAIIQGATDAALAFNVQLVGNADLGIVGLLPFLASVLPGTDFKVLDSFAVIQDVVASPGDFGLFDAENACVTPNVPPFSCRNPNDFLFWDGVHPTKAGHAILADTALDVLSH
jgi:outer membrane lipase/esterase